MTEPITPDERVALREMVAALDEAWESDTARPLVTEHATLTLLAHVASAVPRLLDALDTAEAEVARLTVERDQARSAAIIAAPDRATVTPASDALDLLDEMNREGRIEYSDYSALHDAVSTATVSPAWDEDTVTEDVARALREASERLGPWTLASEVHQHLLDVARAVLAVVRRHLPTRPARETIERALRDAGLVEVEAVHEGHGAEEAVHAHLRPVVDAVLAVSGESRAQVQAEALREAHEKRLSPVHALGDRWKPGERVESVFWRGPYGPEETRPGTVERIERTYGYRESLVIRFDDGEVRDINPDVMRHVRADRLKKGADRG